MIKTILVPTDGSAHAKKAIDLAADIAEKYDARLVLLHVLLRHSSESDIESLCAENAMPDALAKKFSDLRDNWIDMSVASGEPGPMFILVPDDILRDVADLVLQNAQQRAQSKSVKNITTQIVDGSPADKIIAVAAKEEADMIVMGSRGLGKVAGVLMGSVSHKVNNQSDCTCVTVK